MTTHHIGGGTERERRRFEQRRECLAVIEAGQTAHVDKEIHRHAAEIFEHASQLNVAERRRRKVDAQNDALAAR